MNFRPVQWDDADWILDGCRGLPGRPVTKERVFDWIERWTHRTDEVCLVAELGRPVGLITYRANLLVAKVDMLLVERELRGRGFGRRIWNALKDKLVAEGIMVAEFKTIPGAIRDQLGKRFLTDDGIHGRVTWDMEV